MADFTPGPWAVSPFRAVVVCDKFGTDGDFLPVAQMLWPTKERSEAETYANANLIAAAPVLLEALEESARLEAKGVRHCTPEELDRAKALRRAAIAHAKGAA